MRTASGATAVQIMHKRGRRVLGIDHIGSARTEAELALLEAVAHERLHAGQEQLPLDPGGTSASTAAAGLGATVAGTASLVLWEAREATLCRWRVEHWPPAERCRQVTRRIDLIRRSGAGR